MNMNMGASQVENQMFAGLSGTIIVGDDRTLLPPALQNITTHTLELKDIQIDSTEHILQNVGLIGINPQNPSVRLVNGMLQPVISMQPGETQLWRIVNAGADISYHLTMAGYSFDVISEDGQPVASAWTATDLLMPPARRFDVLVTASLTGGTASLQTNAMSTGPAGFTYPTAPIATVDVAGTPQLPAPSVTGAMAGAAPDLSNAPLAQRRTLTLTENNNGMYINGKSFDFNQSIFDTPAVLGTVEEWKIINATGEIHPFHLHTSSFQVMSINGVAQPYRGAQDVEPVPYQVNKTSGNIVIRVAFNDYTGRYMFHCHIAGHEDFGMMSFINVVAAPTAPPASATAATPAAPVASTTSSTSAQ